MPVGKAIVNKWDLRLNSSVPLDLEVETGAGESVLDLRGLDLADLQVNTGAGQTSIDLSSELQHDLHASVEAGVGDLSVKMPSGMGVRVSAASSIGSLTNTGPSKDGEYYVNEAYGTAPHTLFLDINAGIGSINLLAN